MFTSRSWFGGGGGRVFFMQTVESSKLAVSQRQGGSYIIKNLVI